MIKKSVIKFVFEDEVLQISIDSASSLLRLTWRQHPDSAHYRRGYEQAIQLALEYKTKYWLTDSRKVLYLPMPDQHWMYSQLFALLTSGQLSRFAIVMHPETFMTTDKAPISHNAEQQHKLEKPMNMDLCLDLPSALAWLAEDVYTG